eukprot:9109740-Ditylum_brightwellii.AAC.1
MANYEVPQVLILQLRQWTRDQNIDEDGIADVSIIADSLGTLSQEFKLMDAHRGAQLSEQMTRVTIEDRNPNECVQCNTQVTEVFLCYKCLEGSCHDCRCWCDACENTWGCVGCEEEEDWICEQCTEFSRQYQQAMIDG